MITQNAGTADILALMVGAMRTFAVLPPTIMKLGMVFDEAGEELALTGGFVCDAFLGVIPHDLDMTTSAHPEHIEELPTQWGNATWGIGEEFGAIGGCRGDLVVEVTIYRTDKCEIGPRKSEVTFGDTFGDGLTRRDFMINVMTMYLPQMAPVDPYGGFADFANDNLCAPMPVEQSFDDDPLRIMRAARSSAQLGLDVNMDVMNAMGTVVSRLETVSAEHIRTELGRLITSLCPRHNIELMVHTGVAGIVLPRVVDLVSAVDEHKCHKDAYECTLTAIEQAMDLGAGPGGVMPASDFILCFATLMYDVGKPATHRLGPNGTVSFRHYEIIGTKTTRKRMKALYFDKTMIEAVSSLVALHLRSHGYGEAAWPDSVMCRYMADAGDFPEHLHRLTRTDCTTHNRRKANYLFAAYDDLETHIVVLCEQGELDAIRPDLDSDRIMEILELRPLHTAKIARDYLLELRVERGPLGEEAVRQALLNRWALDDVHALAEEYQARQAHQEAKVAERKARKAAAKATREAQGQ